MYERLILKPILKKTVSAFVLSEDKSIMMGCCEHSSILQYQTILTNREIVKLLKDPAPMHLVVPRTFAPQYGAVSLIILSIALFCHVISTHIPNVEAIKF
jgi:hypothetical protein